MDFTSRSAVHPVPGRRSQDAFFAPLPGSPLPSRTSTRLLTWFHRGLPFLIFSAAFVGAPGQRWFRHRRHHRFDLRLGAGCARAQRRSTYSHFQNSLSRCCQTTFPTGPIGWAAAAFRLMRTVPTGWRVRDCVGFHHLLDNVSNRELAQGTTSSVGWQPCGRDAQRRDGSFTPVSQFRDGTAPFCAIGRRFLPRVGTAIPGLSPCLGCRMGSVQYATGWRTIGCICRYAGVPPESSLFGPDDPVMVEPRDFGIPVLQRGRIPEPSRRASQFLPPKHVGLQCTGRAAVVRDEAARRQDNMTDACTTWRCPGDGDIDAVDGSTTAVALRSVGRLGATEPVSGGVWRRFVRSSAGPPAPPAVLEC